MVNRIDIKKLNLEELSGVVSLYPWFSQARMELCCRLGEAGACSELQLAASALYLPSRRKLYAKVHGEGKADCSDKDVEALIKAYLSPAKPISDKPRVVVAGADFFSTEEYRSVENDRDRISFKPKGDLKGAPDTPAVVQTNENGLEIYSETLARIYIEQGYLNEAKEIYSKLILRYPEKSVYFASLIEKINNI